MVVTVTVLELIVVVFVDFGTYFFSLSKIHRCAGHRCNLACSHKCRINGSEVVGVDREKIVGDCLIRIAVEVEV